MLPFLLALLAVASGSYLDTGIGIIVSRFIAIVSILTLCIGENHCLRYDQTFTNGSAMYDGRSGYAKERIWKQWIQIPDSFGQKVYNILSVVH